MRQLDCPETDADPPFSSLILDPLIHHAPSHYFLSFALYIMGQLVGTIGHVAHGKSQTVKAISGVQTVRFKNELERNITIKLGYANAKVSCNRFP